MNLSIIIPCYNEVENIAKLKDELIPVVTRLMHQGSSASMPISSIELILVDDGSNDGTLSAMEGLFKDYQEADITIRFERHSVNRGLGAALRTGFAAASGDIIVTTDSDGTYRHEQIPDLLACLGPDVDMVTASPYHPDGGIANVPAYRLVLSRGSSFIYRLIVRWRIHTYTALFRVYRRDWIKNVPFHSNGFLAGTELLVNGMQMGYRVAEFPTVLHSRVHGVSKAKLARTIWAHLQFQGLVLLRRLGLAAPLSKPGQAETVSYP